jgi:drug/metabolite transporter (DMT)-like permease
MEPVEAGTIWRGTALGVAAGAAWATAFLAPELARQFSPMELMVGRYLAYGVMALVLIAPRQQLSLTRLDARQWWVLTRLGLVGNIVYYTLAASAVQHGGIAMTSLVLGFLPVVISVAGTRERGGAPLNRLFPSLLAGGAGMLCLTVHAFATEHRRESMLGFAYALGALVSWTLYAVGNSRRLYKTRDVSPHDWTLLIGLTTGVQALLLAVPVFAFSAHQHEARDWPAFIGIVVAIGATVSIVGNVCWNYASRLLPLTMAGQMILFETLFGLLYGFAWEARWPSLSETMAIALVCGSVLLAARAHQTQEAGELPA